VAAGLRGERRPREWNSAAESGEAGGTPGYYGLQATGEPRSLDTLAGRLDLALDRLATAADPVEVVRLIWRQCCPQNLLRRGRKESGMDLQDWLNAIGEQVSPLDQLCASREIRHDGEALCRLDFSGGYDCCVRVAGRSDWDWYARTGSTRQHGARTDHESALLDELRFVTGAPSLPADVAAVRTALVMPTLANPSSPDRHPCL
jgi:hypothetical protein